MKRLNAGILLALPLFWAPVLFAASETVNADDGLGAGGYDLVAYFDGKAVEGKAEHSTEVGGVTYRFSSAENRAKFEANPQKYLPKYGGYCAYAMLDGDKVDVNPRSFKVIDGQLYLFYDGFWGDTLKKWNKMLDKRPEAELIEQADGHWKKIVEKGG